MATDFDRDTSWIPLQFEDCQVPSQRTTIILLASTQYFSSLMQVICRSSTRLSVMPPRWSCQCMWIQPNSHLGRISPLILATSKVTCSSSRYMSSDAFIFYLLFLCIPHEVYSALCDLEMHVTYFSANNGSKLVSCVATSHVGFMV